jgi:hypothetical protein
MQSPLQCYVDAFQSLQNSESYRANNWYMIPFSPRDFEVSKKKGKALALQVVELNFGSCDLSNMENDSVVEMGS